MAQSPQKGVSVSLDRISRLLEDFPISSRMGRARRLAGSRRVLIGLNTAFVSGALAAAALTMLHFIHSGWPLASADPLLVVAAGILFLFAYAFKAWGWQRLFPEGQRPQALTLAAAGGAASVGGVALPGRFDEAIRIAVAWALRALAVFVLLNALAIGGSFTLALTFLCASAASAALPIAPAGAATQAGAGAAILIVGGIPKGQALAFAIAAQGLVIL